MAACIATSERGVNAQEGCYSGRVVADFVCGYETRAAGDETLLAFLPHFVIVVIPCESTWQLDPPASGHIGLAQFSAGTWAMAARTPDADPYDAFEQGYAVAEWTARLLAEGSHPASRGGWLGTWYGCS